MAQTRVPPGASFAHAVAVRNLDDQLARISSLDTKAGILMAVEGVVISLLLGSDSLLPSAPVLLSTSIAALVMFAVVAALLSFTNRRYRSAPEPDAVIRFMTASEEWLKWRFLGNLEEALAANDGKLVQKARLLTASITSFIAAVLLLGAYFVQAVARGTLEVVHGS
jgi:hypothetical protein